MKYYGNELYHWGIFGMHWGIRRYQNEDGSLTEEGKKRYSRGESNYGIRYKVGEKRLTNRLNRIEKTQDKLMSSVSESKQFKAAYSNLSRQATQEALNQPNRVTSIGQQTIVNRTLASIGGLATIGASVVAGSALSPVFYAAIPPALAATGVYWYNSKH